jgi:PadR family transcriptional regulator PadR
MATPIDIQYECAHISYRIPIGRGMPQPTTLLRGTLDLLILKALTPSELHGLGVSRRIHQITRATFDVQAGSLFPALHRLEEAGWLASTWKPSENNRRAKYYRLTKAGQRQLADETTQWNRIAVAIDQALKA